MPVSDLRPDITVFQVFEDAAPTAPPTVLPVGLIGINRQFVYRGDAGSFVGGQPGQQYQFPELIAGSIVEQPGAELDVTEFSDVLEPHVYIQNNHGVGEVLSGDITYDFVTTPPNFSLAPGASVTFQITDGDNGSYAASTGYFMDPDEDFVDDEVAAGDVIEVLHSDGSYYPMFDVVDILSDDQLDVTRRNKGVTPILPNATLSAEDAFGFRTLTDLNQQFEQNGVDADDLVTLDGWDVVTSVAGGDYTGVGGGSGAPATSRLFSDPTALFITAGPVIIGDLVFSSDALGDWVPFFYVSAPPVIETALPDVENIITTPAFNPPVSQTGSGVPYDVVRYGVPEDLTGAAVTSSTTGEYDADGVAAWGQPAPPAGQRIFHDASANYTAGTVVAGDEIIIDNLAGVPPYYGIGNWPVFIVQSVPSATELVVAQHDSTSPLPAATVISPTFVSYEIRTPSVVTGNTAGAYQVEGTGAGGPTERRMTAAGVDFLTAGVAPGDWIRDRVTGDTLFTVVTVHPAGVGTLDVVNIVSGNPPATNANPRFAFDVTDQNAATLVVVSVVSDTELSVKNAVAGSPSSGEHTGTFINSVTYPDTGQDINYHILKTLTGSALTGSVLCTYAARRTDLLNQRVPIDESNYETILGKAVPGNDLALAASNLFDVLGAIAYAIQVTDDTVDDWEDGLKLAESDEIYIPCVLTQREDILVKLRDHVRLMSEPEEKRERISYQCHKEVVQETRTSRQSGDALTFNKTASGTTTIVSTTRDLSSFGVVVGDVFTGTLDDGAGGEYPQTQVRIISIQAATPVAGQSTMRIVADAAVPAPLTGTVTGSWTILSKNLSLLERAQAQAEYATELLSGLDAKRRIRNLWPDTVQIRFTDETAGEDATYGIFGGGDQIATIGGWLMTVIEAGKRSNENPRQPLTGFPGGSIYKIIDPMGDIQEYQDIIIDGGNYYMIHDGDDQPPYAIRAISTDTSDIFKLEDNVAAQVDSFARKLRAQLKPLLGPFVIDEPFFDLVSHNFEAVRKDVVEQNRELREIVLRDIQEDPDRPDTFIIRCEVDPYISAAEGEVYIYI